MTTLEGNCRGYENQNLAFRKRSLCLGFFFGKHVLLTNKPLGPQTASSQHSRHEPARKQDCNQNHPELLVNTKTLQPSSTHSGRNTSSTHSRASTPAKTSLQSRQANQRLYYKLLTCCLFNILTCLPGTNPQFTALVSFWNHPKNASVHFSLSWAALAERHRSP